MDGLIQEDGSYDNFDSSEFTSRSGGKLKAILHIKVSGYTLKVAKRMHSKP